MSRRQKNYTPRVCDEQFNKMVKLLKSYWGYDKDSDLIHHLIISSYNEVIKLKKNNA